MHLEITEPAGELDVHLTVQVLAGEDQHLVPAQRGQPLPFLPQLLKGTDLHPSLGIRYRRAPAGSARVVDMRRF